MRQSLLPESTLMPFVPLIPASTMMALVSEPSVAVPAALRPK